MQTGGVIDCKNIADELKREAKKLLDEKKLKLEQNLNQLSGNFSNATKKYSHDAIDKLLA